MASGYSDAEQKINLSVLQQKDPYIIGIADSASQVAAYSFNAALNGWEKTNIEGTLFVYTRSAFPLNGFMIINRLHLNDLIEPINKNLEFQLQDPFLLYKNSQSSIYGIWFYDRDECARIGQLMNSLVQVATDTQNQESGRQRRASESDTAMERPLVAVDAAMCSISPQKNNVDILQMLSKAQDEYDKGTATCSSPSKLANGASPQGNKHYAAYNGVILGQGQLGPANHQQNATTHINLETLFKKALQQNEKAFSDQRAAGNNMKSAFHLLPIPLSNQTTPTVEEIERAQRESTAGSMGVPPGTAGTKDGKSGIVAVSMMGYHQSAYTHHQHQPEVDGSVAPESPNTALRRTLKIIPPSSSSSTTSGNPHRPSSVANKEQAMKQADMNQTSKAQPTVVQALFSQQTGRLSSQGIPSRTSISSLFGGSQAMAAKYVQPNEAARDRPWAGMECLPSTNLPEKQSQRCTPIFKEIFSRQTSVDGLAKPDNFLPIAVKNPDLGITATSTTTLLSPMAFQTPGKLGKCERREMTFFGSDWEALPDSLFTYKGKSTMSELEEQQAGQQQQVVSSVLREASDLIKNHVVPRNRSPYDENPLPVEPDMLPFTPLNKEQLRQALITLLKTDNSFITAIHEAYTASLNSELSRQRNRRDGHF